MSIDFRGKIIEAIQNTHYSTDAKVLLINALPLQVSESYLGACKTIIEGDESVAEKLKLLQATFSGLRPENEYSFSERSCSEEQVRGGPLHDPLIVLELKLIGEKSATPKLVQDLERALPSCTLTENPSGKLLTVTLGAAGRLDAVEAVRKVLYEHGFVRRDLVSEPAA